MRNVPVRRCIGCMEGKPKEMLIRVVKNKKEEIFLDLTGKAEGRGAYLCRKPDCVEKAQKRRQLERAFKSKISDEIYDNLKEEMKKYE